jgi:two-component system response regulator GlrR
MTPSRILLLDFHDKRGVAAALGAVLEGVGPVESVPCQASVDGKLDRFEQFVHEKRSLNGQVVLFVLLPALLQERAVSIIQTVKQKFSRVTTAIVLESEEPDFVMEVIRCGVDEFFVPPFRPIDILPRLHRLLERAKPEETLIETLKRNMGLRQLVGESPVFVEQMKKIPLVSKFNTQVLILGETGTGKELCGRSIHYLSPRANKPFVPINCGAVPVDLVENELFGHVRGAFTGAATSRAGLIEEAEGGTLFLDEVDCLPLLAQVKLLRFLQEKEYRPLGSTVMRQANVRVIAAANSNLEEATRSGRLREDLFYRLNIVPIMLPPLRERTEDIIILAQHFLKKFEIEFDKEIDGFAPAALHRLMVHSWPGNIRELEHVIERAVVLAREPIIQTEDLVLSLVNASEREESLQQAKARMVEKFEKTYIQGLLVAYHGNISQAAQAAKKNRRAFWQLIRRYQIDVQRFKPGNHRQTNQAHR